jgi:hypothetical protein
MHFRFVRKAMLAVWPGVARFAYRPEKYYLRGPDPMTLDTIGEMLRARDCGQYTRTAAAALARHAQLSGGADASTDGHESAAAQSGGRGISLCTITYF